MIFRRTNSGLSNQRLFFGVDEVVYVEGGVETFDLDTLIDGAGDSRTDDTSFWGNVFSIFRPTKKVHILSVGSKNTLREIANLVATGEINNVFVAMDRDYDSYHGTLISAPGVLYTQGYSFENEIWNPVTVHNIFKKLWPRERESAQPAILVNQAFGSFYSVIFRAIKVNIALSCSGESLLLSDPAESFLLFKKGQEPRFDVLHFRKCLRRRNRARKCFRPAGIQVDSHSDCHGKVMAAWGYRVLLYVLAQYSKVVTLPKLFATGLAITTFAEDLSAGALPGYRQHYEEQFAALPA